MRRPSIALVISAVAFLMPAGCGGGVRRPPTQSRPSPPARLSGAAPLHLAVVVMENEEYGDVIGRGHQMPYINALARRYSLATQDYAISHPSLPNYLALTGGSTHGIDSDCSDCSVPGGGLAGQLQARHVSWRAYMEDLPRPCFGGSDAGEYAKKHDPFVYYRAVAASPAACSHVVPLRELRADEAASRLPAFTWITPNLCHDMHDCAPSAGDRWLHALVPGLLRALGPRGLLFLTWDEGSTDNGCCRLATGGHTALIVAGAGARRGGRLSTPVDHYSVLQAIEDLLGLPRLGGAACGCTPSLQPLLAGSRAP